MAEQLRVILGSNNPSLAALVGHPFRGQECFGLDNRHFSLSWKTEQALRRTRTDRLIFISAQKPPAGKEGNWLATPPGRGCFAILRLYAPTERAIYMSWKPGDIGKEKQSAKAHHLMAKALRVDFSRRALKSAMVLFAGKSSNKSIKERENSQN